MSLNRSAGDRQHGPGSSGGRVGSQRADAGRSDDGPQSVERLRDAPTAEALGEHAQACLGIALGEHARDAYRRSDPEDQRADDQQDPWGAVAGHDSVVTAPG